MLQYPSINGSARAPLDKPCIAFYKYDGSNLRWEWSPKQGWNKFGTRRQLFDHTDPLYSQAIPLFMDKLGDEIVHRVKQDFKNPQRITAFTEFLGENSFAGSHVQDEPKELKLFDVFIFQKAFIKPKQFVEMFSDLPECAEVVYEGNLNKKFIMDVQKGRIRGLNEGVIAKGNDFMVKIKTDDYFVRLRHRFNDDWQKYGE